MTKLNSIADHLRSWQLLSTAVKNNAGDLQHLAEDQAALEAAIAAVNQFTEAQEGRASQAQQSTKDMQAVMTNGRKVASRLRTSLRGKYGPDAEKLVEFGVRPLRPHNRGRSKPPTNTPSA